MKKKKSLVGWTRDNWYDKIRMVRYPKYCSEQLLIPCINTKPKHGRHPNHIKVKVRITIEEI